MPHFRFKLLLMMPLALAACQEQETVEVPPPVVRAEVVRLVSGADTVTYAGVVVPRRETPEAFRVGGKITARPVDVGDVLRAGDEIARLDDIDLKLALEASEAERTAAAAALAQAETERTRFASLAAGGAVSRSTDEQRRLAAEEARARFDKAERAVQLDRNRLGYARLVAGADGVVTAVSAEPGQVVAAGEAVVTLAPLGEREIEVFVPESRLAAVDGASATVRLWAGGRDYAARLREVAPRADALSRTYRARYALLDADEAVRFGMTATLSLTKGDPAPVALLPATAILDEGEGPAVFVIGDDGRTLRKRAVTLARFGDGSVTVSSGLEDGERVVTLGTAKLQDGETVRPLVDEARS